MCGNGLRCVVLHVARARGLSRGDFVVETDAGTKACVFELAAGAVAADADEAMVTVDMGPVRVTGDISIDGVDFVLADAGNPHAIAFGTFDAAAAARIGPRVATHDAFPAGTNVELARVARDASGAAAIDLVVWERGVGLTQACGTGACATVAAAAARGLAPRGAPVIVHLPGGDLSVTIGASGAAVMRGPARRVFEGKLG
jgi:diaminopimelate epimerase